MMLAGRAYTNKLKLLQEFSVEFNNVRSQLTTTHKIGFNNTVVKREAKGHVNFTLFKGKKSDQLRHEDEARLEADIKMKYLISKLR